MFNLLNLNERLSLIFTKWIAAFLILLVGLILGKLAGKVIKRVLSKMKLNHLIETSTGFSYSLEEMIALGVEYFIYFIAIVFALDQLSITTTILNIISGALTVFILLSILLAIKDLFPNIIAGIYILNKFRLRRGDEITINGIKGKIKETSLLEIQLITKENEIAHVPTSNFLKEKWKSKHSPKEK